MALLGPNRQRRNRRFDYEPRYYKPEKDDRLKYRMRIGAGVKRRRSPAGLIIFILLFMVVMYVYLNVG